MTRSSGALLSSLLLLPFACTHDTAKKPSAPPTIDVIASVSTSTVSDQTNTPASVTGPFRFLAIGGGPTPESTEVSLEQDIELVRRALPPPGLVLFAGGSSARSVRELDPLAKGDPVFTALGDLFAPRAGRQSRYRAPSFVAERATFENVQARLSAAFAEGGPPLVVYVAAHGDRGADERSNSVALWGGRSLTVTQLAELHERHQRPLRLIATSCFSGGFAELAFANADPSGAQPSRVARCGLFAGTADRETSGCDPNPNRRAQESYGLHVANALAGSRKDGSPLGSDTADYDHDGTVGLLDAHTWARIQSVSFDVPTTTSERWLRRVEPGSAPIDPTILPEDAAVVERLGAALGLSDEAAVRERWNELDQELQALDDSIQQAEEALASRVADQATLLLERWPVLDDPFHPDFERAFRENRTAIQSSLMSSRQARERADADRRSRELYANLDRLSVAEARVLRVWRAYETLHKAAALLKRGGAAAKYYSSLLACERGAP